MHLLNIQSSPRGPRSASIAVADAFLEAYRQVCPGLIVDTLNVWEENDHNDVRTPGRASPVFEARRRPGRTAGLPAPT